MSEVTYEIIEHDGGWANRVDGGYSETFPTQGKWHTETARGSDRPNTYIKDKPE